VQDATGQKYDTDSTELCSKSSDAEDFEKITDSETINKLILKYSKKENANVDDDEEEEDPETSSKNTYALNESEATMSTYVKFFMLLGGLKVCIPYMCTHFIGRALDLWKEKTFVVMTTQEAAEQQGSFGLSATATVYLSVFCLAAFWLTHSIMYYCISESTYRKIVTPTLKTVMNAPVNLYFDMTPLSLLERRFNDDMHHVRHCFGTYNWLVHIVMNTIFTLSVAMYTIPSIIFFVIAVVVISIRFQRRQIFTKSRMKGLGEKTGIPKHRTFNEAVTGSTIIRVN